MRQGAGKNYSGKAGGWKQEPAVRVVSPKAVSQIGSSMGNHVTDRSGSLPRDVISEEMYKGRGFETPRDRSVERFRGGSQGRR